MAKDNVIGLKARIDTLDLKTGIKEIKKHTENAKESFNNAVAGMDRWNQSSDGLKAKLNQLESQLEANEATAAAYKKEIDKVSKKEGDHSVELEALTKKYNAAVREIKNTENSIKHYSGSLEDVQKQEKESESALGKLTSTIKEQETQLSSLQNEYKNAVLAYGENSSEAKALADSIETLSSELDNNKSKLDAAQSSLSNLGKVAEEPKNKLDSLTDEIKKQESELTDLQKEYKNAVLTYGKNSKEAQALATQITNLSGELEDNQKQVKEADDELEKLEKQFDETEEAADDFGKGLDGIKGLGGAVAKGVGAIGAAAAALGGAFLATAEGTREFRNNMAKLETSFTEAGLTAEDATETYKSLYSVLGDEGQATEASTFLAKIADNEKELADMTHTLTGIYATFGASLPLEGLTEAINHTSSLGSVQGNLADALEWSGVNVDDFNEQLAECSDEEERQALIMETLSGIYDGAADTYKEVNADVIANNEAQAELSETMAALGEKAEPILTAVKDGFNEIMQAVLGLVEDVDFDAIAQKIEEGFAYFIDTIIPAIKEGLQWIIDNKDTLIAGIAGIGTAMLAWNVVSIVQGLVTAMKGWKTATEGMTIAQKLLNGAMKANPIGLVISIIAGLVATLITLWTTNEDFRAAVINIWNKVKEAIGTAIETIKKKFNEFKAKFEEIKTKAKEVLDNIVAWFKDIPNKLSDLKDKMLTIGTDLVKGLWNGIKDMVGWITGKLKGFAGDVLGGIKKFFGVNSPSKETAKIGKFLDEGLALGIEKGKGDVLDAADEVGQELLDSFGYLEDELAKKEIGKNLAILNVKAGNPFDGWSIKELNSHLKEARNSLQETNNSIAENISNQENWNGSIESASEYAKSLKDGYTQASSMLDALSQKAEIFAEQGREAPESLTAEITALKEMLKLYESEMKKVKEVTTKLGEDTSKSWIDKFEEGLGLSGNKLDEWQKKFGNTLSKVAGYAEAAINKVGELGSAIMEYQNQMAEQEIQQLEAELETYNATKDEELAKQQELYDNGLISEEQLAAAKAQIEEEKQAKEQETLKKKDEIAKKQFEAQKATSIATALINGALAIVKGFADLGPIGGAINAAAQAVLTGIQVGTIASQKYVPMLQTGGVVDKPTLAMIGENGEEAVVPLKNNTEWIHGLAEKLHEIMQRDYSFGGQLQMQPAIAPIVNNTYNYTQNVTSPKALSRKELYRDGKNLLSLKGIE